LVGTVGGINTPVNQIVGAERGQAGDARRECGIAKRCDNSMTIDPRLTRRARRAFGCLEIEAAAVIK
jgi:hypothetical protein